MSLCVSFSGTVWPAPCFGWNLQTILQQYCLYNSYPTTKSVCTKHSAMRFTVPISLRTSNPENQPTTNRHRERFLVTTRTFNFNQTVRREAPRFRKSNDKPALQRQKR